MSGAPDSTLADPQQIITDLQRQLAECRAERDGALAERDNAQRRLAERTAERDEAWEQQTATAEVLQVINSSPGDLTPVFDALLEKAMQLCEATFGGLTSFDGERFHTLALRGLPTEAVEAFREPWVAGPGAYHENLVRGEPLVHTDFGVADPARRAHPQSRAIMEMGKARTGLIIALCKDERLLGSLFFYRQEIRPFSDKQIALLQNFAEQAVIAMENARLLTETREALEQQTATAEVLQVINSSPGDLAPVFDAMLERATRLCDASFGVLRTWDGECFHVRAVHGEPRFSDWVRERGPARPEGDDPLARITKGAGVVHFADALDDPAYLTSPAFKDAVELSGMRSGITVPLRKDDALQGAITLYRQEVRPFSDKQIALLQNFAAQAVIAMENARLLTETREALEQQTATAEVLQVINSSPGDLGPVFDVMLEKAMSLCGAIFGELHTYDGASFKTSAGRGHSAAFAEARAKNPPAARPGTASARILETKRPVHILDIKAEVSYRERSPASRALIDLGGTRTTLAVPLLKNDTVLGFISFHRDEVKPFTDKQIALLQNFAAQAVIAMENARLLTETREALEQQTATAEVLQVINSSPGDLTPVFDAMLDKAMRLCEVDIGILWTYDGEMVHAAAIHGAPSPLTEFLRRGSRQPSGPQRRLVKGERAIQIADITTTEAYRNHDPLVQTLADLGGIRTLLTVPLRTDSTVLGNFAIFRQEVRPFADKQIALLQNFAAQAVIAMENARLLGELRQRTDEVAELNRGLEARVAEQVEELGRVGRLRRFLAPQLAELIVSQGDEKVLESHRREIVVVFCDLRGYTAFTETAEPEDALNFLREYHGTLGPLVSQFEGTLDHFAGDGIMVFFNDPLPCPDPAERAVRMAMAMREEAGKLIAAWRRHGSELGFGAGIAQGYATLGQIGFSDRSGYTAIGTVCNLAARLCAEAQDGQILVSSRIAGAVEAVVKVEDLGNLELKGLRRPVATFNVVQSATGPGPN